MGKIKSFFSSAWAWFRPLLLKNQSALCIGAAMIGFLYAIFVFLYPYKPPRITSFGEITIDNKTKLLSDMLGKRVLVLNRKMDTIKSEYKSLRNLGYANTPKTAATTDMTKLAADSAKIAVIIQSTKKDIYLLNEHNADTSMSLFSRYIYVKKKPLLDAINSDSWADDSIHTAEVSVILLDTCRYLPGNPVASTSTLILKQHKRAALMDFIGDYPTFGLWIVLSIAQIMMWFILCPLLAGNLLTQKDKLGKLYDLTLGTRILNVLLPIGFITIFCGCFYLLLLDRYIITDHYFLMGFTHRMEWYAVPGYLIAAFCFNSYLTLANQFDAVNNDYMIKLKAAAPANPPPMDQFLSLKGAFDNTFFCSALVLSLFVFCEAILIYAVNNTELFRFYQQETGKPLIPGDFVYLMGLLHTCMLLAFYIPARLKFNTLPIVQQAVPGIPQPNSLQTILSGIGTLLVTVSPMIAGLVQNLLGFIFK